jgi:peptidoglycan/xylan/chitin deacetylase (PgdA/CDA1 family)
MTAGSRTLEGRDDVLNLCFHGIGVPGRELEPGEENNWVEAAQFEELLDVIVRFPSVRISFDDGNSSDAELALPALRRRNLTATFFVLS